MRGFRFWGGAALWWMVGTASLAAAQGSFFAPRAKATDPVRAPASSGGPAEPAVSGGAAGRITAGSGLFPPEIKVDGAGRKTLVIHGEGSPEPEAGEKGARRTPVGRDRAGDAGGPAAGPPEEKPYWVVEARTVQERPYFLAEKKEAEQPYWLIREQPDETPYWLTRARPPDRPYWEIPPERVEIVAQIEPELTAPPAAPEPTGDLRTISYFMFQDELGIKHLTNVPNDPRYREFTVTIKIQRGLAGSLRFTHASLRPIIMRAALAYNLDPALIAAVIKSESAFDAHAVSWAGAQGLMQLMPATARAMGCLSPFDPEQNVMAGSRYLRQMLNTFGGDLTLAVASYNCGPERVKRLGRVPNIPETRNYVVIVARNYEHYKGQF
ncbi:MAG: lytic transglycosylase domain-containing protein [Candidatus Adiutrix sp.]|jgi:soluble lytic murein transglycosylase|nr:lytic transglycosylase domain-containing protein [Candidatus Adiutrix sp.]